MLNRAQIRAFEVTVLPFELRVIDLLRGAEGLMKEVSEALTTVLSRHDI